MKFLKWALFFTASFLIAWIVIFTFIQEPFKQQVSAKIFSYETPAIPVYLYVAGALALGLLIGILMTLYYSIALKAEMHKKNKIIDRLERELETRVETEEKRTHELPPPGKEENQTDDLKAAGIGIQDESETERFLDRNDEA
ncbi:MAG: DUF1049 domain-containing protein [Chitinivibrionales bacterium]|nr:DUF1049 domain-containing protein [Chitinivibrionales bacterium]